MKAAEPAFSAKLHFLPLEHSGRKTYPFQGYRPSVQFESGVWVADHLYPEFLDSTGSVIPEHTEVPQDVDVQMYTWSDDVIETLLDQVHEGVHFRLTEGAFPKFLVAVGTVTAIGPYLEANGKRTKPG